MANICEKKGVGGEREEGEEKGRREMKIVGGGREGREEGKKEGRRERKVAGRWGKGRGSKVREEEEGEGRNGRLQEEEITIASM